MITTAKRAEIKRRFDEGQTRREIVEAMKLSRHRAMEVVGVLRDHDLRGLIRSELRDGIEWPRLVTDLCLPRGTVLEVRKELEGVGRVILRAAPPRALHISCDDFPETRARAAAMMRAMGAPLWTEEAA